MRSSRQCMSLEAHWGWQKRLLQLVFCYSKAKVRASSYSQSSSLECLQICTWICESLNAHIQDADSEKAFYCSCLERSVYYNQCNRGLLFWGYTLNPYAFLKFAFEGTVYEYPVLSFRLSVAPLTFGILAKAAPFNKRGVILACLNSWILIAGSREQAATQLLLFLSHIRAQCFSVNFQKSSLNPESANIFPQFGNMHVFQSTSAPFHWCLSEFHLGCRLLF